MLQIRFKRGTAAQNDALTENAGVLSVDTDVFGLRIHDGLTAGGHALVVGSAANSLQSQIDALGIADVDGLEAALAAKAQIDLLGADNGIATLNVEGVLPTEQLPSYVEDVIDVATLTDLPAVGEVGKLYIILDANELYRWSGGQQQYYQISATIDSTDDVSEGQINLYYTDTASRESFGAGGGITYDSANGVFTFNESVNGVNGETGSVIIDKSHIGLGSVENFGVASEQEVQEATVSDKFVTSALTRTLAETLGFSETNGDWAFSEEFLAALRLQGVSTTLTDIPVAKQLLAATTIDDKIYVYGGYDETGSDTDSLYRYDPDTDSWAQLANGPMAMRSHSAVTINGKMYVCGGVASGVGNLDTLYEYDPDTDSWAQLANNPIASSGNHTAAVINGVMYVYGGFNDGALAAYDPVTDQWSIKASAPSTRSTPAPAVVGGKLYVFGGTMSNNSLTNSLYRYDPDTDQWETLPNGPKAVSSHVAVAIHDKMYVYGGYDGSPINDLYEYDPVESVWEKLPDGPIAKYRHAASELDGKLYVFGGRNNSATELSSAFSIE